MISHPPPLAAHTGDGVTFSQYNYLEFTEADADYYNGQTG